MHVCFPLPFCGVLFHWGCLSLLVLNRAKGPAGLMWEGHIYTFWGCGKVRDFTRGGRQRPEKRVLLKCELSMGAPAGNNQAQYPEVALIALELECCQLGKMSVCLRREP